MKDRFYTALTNSLARLLKTPQYIILFVSDVCWMKCDHCWYNERWKETHLTGAPLTFKELEKLAGSIDRIQFISFTGGEAFLRKDIVEIIEMFAHKTKMKRYDIPTSGYNTDLVVSTTERMLKNNQHIPFRVDVSLDGTENTHDKIRNVTGAYKRCIATIRALKQLKQRYSYFDIGVITTISKHNQDEVAAIADIVHDVDLRGEWMINIARGDSRDPSACQVDIDKYFMAHEIIEGWIKTGNYKGHSGHMGAAWLTAKNATRRKVIKKILSKEKTGGGCAAGSLGGVIFNDGTIRPCEMLDQSFGNIRDYDYHLPALWNSRQATELRKWIQETRCLCTHECFLSISLLIQPQYWPDMLRERLILSLGRRRGIRSTCCT